MTTGQYQRAERETVAADLSRPPMHVVLSEENPRQAIGCLFQSVTVDPQNPRRLVLAEYWPPYVRFATIAEQGNGDIILAAETAIVARARASAGLQMRLFPEAVPGAGATRIQCAVLMPSGKLLISRGGEPNGCAYLLSPPQRADESQWLFEGPLSLEGGEGLLESLCYHQGKLYALWTRSYKEPSSAVTIHTPSGERTGTWSCPAVTWLYGIGFRGEDHVPYFVTDWRAGEECCGIYRGEKLVVPGITGVGIAFLPNGGAIVADHRYSLTDFGRPAEIVCIPPHRFE